MENTFIYYGNELYHYGINGQKWGLRRWQNEDGSLTPEGRIHYGYTGVKTKKDIKLLKKNIRSDRELFKEKGSKRYKLDQAEKEKNREDRGNALKKEITNKVLGEDAYDAYSDVLTSTKSNEKYERQLGKVDKYVENELIKKYGKKNYNQFVTDEANKEAIISGIALLGSLGLSYYLYKKL